MANARTLLTGCRIATMARGAASFGLTAGAIGVENGRVAFVGAVPAGWENVAPDDLGGRLVTPALIDCHTHLVFGGSRANEWEMRLQGANYEAIARAGGGIRSTVRATRAMTEEELVQAALPRLDALLSEGVRTVEIKSGYGLTVEDEIKMLRVARKLGKLRPVRIATSWLAAHAVPPEFEGRSSDYIEQVALPGLDAAHAAGLVDAVDGFCEGIAFSVAEMGLVFAHAHGLGLPVKLHAEQLSNLGGAKLAAGFGALSADHLEYLGNDGIAAMAAAGTVAVLLPGAYYFLRETRSPPVQALRHAGIPIAVATDCNPGSSPMTSLLLAMNMACTLFRLTPEEALAGVTREAARALGLGAQVGTIEPGMKAELAVWDVEHPAELAYRIGFNPLARVFPSGPHEREERQ